MKHKNVKGKIYVSYKCLLGRSETFCREFCREKNIASPPPQSGRGRGCKFSKLANILLAQSHDFAINEVNTVSLW